MEDLVIPIRMDLSKAQADLAALANQGKTVGATHEESAKQATTAYQRMAEQVISVATAQVGLGAVQQTFAAMRQGLEQTSEYASKLAKEFVDLRHSLSQIAALTGQKGDAAMTVGQAEQAAAASLTPEEWKNFGEKFQAQAGAYLGNAPGAKLTDEQSIGIQQRVAEFAKSRGVRPDEAAALMGTVIQEAKPGTSPQDMLARFGSLFQVAEKAVGPTAPQLAKIQELTGSGFESGEAARAANIFAVGAQGEEATFAMIARRALDEVRLSGKGDELGLKRGQTPMQMMEAAAGALSQQVAGGADEAELLKKYFADSREQRAMRILMNRGVGASEFENTRKLLGSTDKDYVESTITAWEQTPEGRQQGQEAMAALNRIRHGARQEELEIRKKEAEAQLEGEGRFEQFQPGDILRGRFGSGTTREQLIRERTMENITGEAASLGIDSQDTRRGNAFLQVGNEPNERMMRILEDIAAHTRQGTEQRARAADKPLSAPPPNPTKRD